MTSISFDKHGAAQKPRLLDEVRAKSVPCTTVDVPRNPTPSGSNVTSFFTASATPGRWVRLKSRRFFLRWLPSATFRHRPRIRRWRRYYFSTVKCWPLNCLGWTMWSGLNHGSLPVVLTRNEIQLLLDRLEGTHGLMARLMYGTGMRLLDGMRHPQGA